MKQIIYFFFLAPLILTSCGGGNSNNHALAASYIKQSIIEAETHNYKKSLQLVNKALESEKKPHYLAMKATLLFQIGDAPGSINLFKELIAHKETPTTVRAEAKNNLACVYISIKKKKEAEQLWNELLDDPDYISPEVLYLNLALVKIDSHDFAQATNLLYKALNHAPEYIDALYYLAYTQKELKEYAKALKTIDMLTNYVANHPEAIRLKKQIEISMNS